MGKGLVKIMKLLKGDLEKGVGFGKLDNILPGARNVVLLELDVDALDKAVGDINREPVDTSGLVGLVSVSVFTLGGEVFVDDSLDVIHHNRDTLVYTLGHVTGWCGNVAVNLSLDAVDHLHGGLLHRIDNLDCRSLYYWEALLDDIKRFAAQIFHLVEVILEALLVRLRHLVDSNEGAASLVEHKATNGVLLDIVMYNGCSVVEDRDVRDTTGEFFERDRSLLLCFIIIGINTIDDRLLLGTERITVSGLIVLLLAVGLTVA